MKTILPFLLLTAVPMTPLSHAAVVQLSFSGTYDTNGGTVFGQSGPAVPYNYQITYDTSLNTNSESYPTGAKLDGLTTTHEWHGYSASGVVSANLTFGTQAWAASSLVARTVVAGITADLWLDTDISMTTPARAWVFFDAVPSNAGTLQLGGGMRDTTTVFMRQISTVEDRELLPPGPSLATSQQMAIASIPEPSLVALLAIGAGFPLIRTRRRQSNQ